MSIPQPPGAFRSRRPRSVPRVSEVSSCHFPHGPHPWCMQAQLDSLEPWFIKHCVPRISIPTFVPASPVRTPPPLRDDGTQRRSQTPSAETRGVPRPPHVGGTRRHGNHIPPLIAPSPLLCVPLPCVLGWYFFCSFPTGRTVWTRFTSLRAEINFPKFVTRLRLWRYSVSDTAIRPPPSLGNQACATIQQSNTRTPREALPTGDPCNKRPSFPPWERRRCHAH